MPESLRTEVAQIKSNIEGQIEELTDLNPEVNFVESIMTAGKELYYGAETSYTMAIAQLGNKEEIEMLELCSKYENNIVAVLKGEFGTDLRTLMLSSKRTESEEKANAFLLKVLELASRNKLSLSLRW